MSRFKFSSGIFATLAVLIMLLAMSQVALADPEPAVQDDRNSSATGIPFVHTMNAGATADLSGITYTISITGTAKEDGTLGSYASTGIEPLTLPFANGVITPATPDPAADADRSSDATKVWVDSKTLAQLFGSDDKNNTDAANGYPKFADNFPQAGIYKFTIAETRAGDNASKWKYEPWNTTEDTAGTYTLVVFVANDIGANANIANRHYDGWYLIDNTTGDKVAINTADNSESGADFASTYKVTVPLNVTKQVSGDYASTTYQFPQTITVTLPEWYDESVDGTISATTVSEGVTITRDTVRSHDNVIVFTTALAHNQAVQFNVPVGTRYSVAEDVNVQNKILDPAGLEYEPTIAWTVDDGVFRIGISKADQGTSDGGTFQVTNASGTEEITAIEPGGEVHVVVSPNVNYAIDTVTVTKKSDGSEVLVTMESDIATFVAPNENVVVNVTFRQLRSTEGSAYAVKTTDTNELILFRSNDNYTDSKYRDVTVRDILGNEYTGKVVGNVEDASAEYPSWGVLGSATTFKVADGQLVKAYNLKNYTKNSYKTQLFKNVFLAGLDTSDVTDMSSMFASSRGIDRTVQNVDLTGIDLSNVTNMSKMFEEQHGLKTVVFGDVDLSSVTDMSEMFASTGDYSNQDPDSIIDLSNRTLHSVTTMKKMFYMCNMRTINISNIYAPAVTDLESMFDMAGYTVPVTVYTAHFKTPSATTMTNMFNETQYFDQLPDLTGWDTSNVRSMFSMFSGCGRQTATSPAVLDISSFSFDKVTSIAYMFCACKATTIYAAPNTDLSGIQYGYDVFTNWGFRSQAELKLVGGAGTEMDVQSSDKRYDKTYARIDGGPSAPGFFTEKK